MIKLEKVSKYYKIDEETTFYALKDASLEIKEKEFISIIGPSATNRTVRTKNIWVLQFRS